MPQAIFEVRDDTVRGVLSEGAAPVERIGLVLADGSVVATTRPQVVNGRRKVAIRLPDELKDGRTRFLDLIDLDNRRPISARPILYRAAQSEPVPSAVDPEPAVPGGEASAPAAIGAVKLRAPAMLRGWAYAPDRLDRKVLVEVLVDGHVVGHATADRPHQTLAERGVRDGDYGFRFDLAPYVAGARQVLVRVLGASEPLEGGSISLAPAQRDGEVACPGFLESADDRTLLARLPFESLAYNAMQMRPERIMPRWINRLRRERLLLEEAKAFPSVALLDGGGDAARRSWSLQSHPRTPVWSTLDDREALPAEWIVVAHGGDNLHPSTAYIVGMRRDADIVTWNRFEADSAEAGAAGVVIAFPGADPIGMRHDPAARSAFAVRTEILVGAPPAALKALAKGDIAPLAFWLAGKNLRWAHHPEALSSRTVAASIPGLGDAEIELFEEMLLAEGERLQLFRGSTPEAPAFYLMPSRRARLTSVIICFRDKSGPTLKGLFALARQRVTGSLEVILIDNGSQPSHAHAVKAGAERLFGAAARVVRYDGTFNHSAQNNLGVEMAGGEVVVFCNNDTILSDETTIEQLGAWALWDGIGTVGCRLEDPSRGRGSYGHGLTPLQDNPFLSIIGENSDLNGSRGVHAVPGVTFALAAMARERFLAVGGLDPIRFPIGYNDADFAARSRRAGLTSLYLGHVSGVHERGSSRTGDNEDLQALLCRSENSGLLADRYAQNVRKRIEVTGAPPKAGAKPIASPAAAVAKTGLLEDAARDDRAQAQSALLAARAERDALEAERAERINIEGLGALLAG